MQASTDVRATLGLRRHLLIKLLLLGEVVASIIAVDEAKMSARAIGHESRCNGSHALDEGSLSVHANPFIRGGIRPEHRAAVVCGGVRAMALETCRGGNKKNIPQ